MRIFLAIVIVAVCTLLGSLVGCAAALMTMTTLSASEKSAYKNYENTLLGALIGIGIGVVLGIAAARYFIRRMR